MSSPKFPCNKLICAGAQAAGGLAATRGRVQLLLRYRGHRGLAGDVPQIVSEIRERLVEVLIAIALEQGMFDVLGENPEGNAGCWVKDNQA